MTPCQVSHSLPPQLSVIIPLFEEAQRIPGSLPKLADALRQLAVRSEVILVVEPCSDATAAIAEKLAGQYGWRVLLQKKHLGKGGAVRAGVLAADAKTEIVCYMDADLSTDLEALSRALAIFKQKTQVGILVADRRQKDSRLPRKQVLPRRVLSRAFNLLVRALFPKIRVRDTQCGFKLFRGSVARAIFPCQRLNGFAFDVELLVLATGQGFAVESLPVIWTDAPRSSVRLLRHGSGMVRDVLALRFCRHRQV